MSSASWASSSATSATATSRPPEPPLLSEIGYRRRNLELILDIALLTLAYYAAFRLRFHEAEDSAFFPPFVRSVPVVVGAQVAGLYAAGKYRQVWRTLTTPELGVADEGRRLRRHCLGHARCRVYRLEGFSRGVFALDALIAFCLLVVSRGAASNIDGYLRKRRASGDPALIYGAGRGGALLVRELLQNRDLNIVPVGFIDDDPRKQSLVIEGMPVLGTLDNLGAIAERYRISALLVAIRDIDVGQLEDLPRDVPLQRPHAPAHALQPGRSARGAHRRAEVVVSSSDVVSGFSRTPVVRLKADATRL